MSREIILSELKKKLIQIDIKGVEELIETARSSVPPLAIIDSLSEAMVEISRKYERKEYFIPEFLVAAEIMKETLETLKPLLKVKKTPKCQVVIGTVKGDIHDIGKNIFKTFMEATGFEIYDLGVDVPAEKFLQAIKNGKPQILGLSSLLTTSRFEIKNIIGTLTKTGIKENVKVIIGGAAVTEDFAEEVSADTFAADTPSGVKKCKKWVSTD